MSLGYSSHTIGSYNHRVNRSGNPITSTINNGVISPSEQNLVRISFRTTEFIRGIEKKVFQCAENLNVKALKDVIRLVSQQGVTPFQEYLLKKSSYFVRFFSDESWEDWSDHRTPLGKVVSMYCDHITTAQPLEASVSRLDKKLLEVANRDAAAILKAFRAEKESSYEQYEAATSSFWSSFLSLPMAGAAPLSKAQFPANFELSSLDGINGFILNGEASGDNSGYSVKSAGDINSDGIADIVVGDYNASPRGRTCAGKSYVIFGSNRGWGSPLNLSSLTGANGFILNGEAEWDRAGSSVSGAGDINGDGIDDLVVGASSASPNNRSAAGKSYVIFGARSGWSSPMELSSLNGTNGFILNGEAAEDFSGYSVKSAGDINSDGIADLVVGAPGAYVASPNNRPYAGKSYVVFGSKGRWRSPIELSKLNGVNGFTLNGESSYDNSGSSVSGAGDINGDGITDLVVGAPSWASPNNRSAAGKSYVIFGARSGWSSPMELSSLNGVNGFILNGEAAEDFSGGSVSGAGDINGDGIADLVVGARSASPNDRSQAGKSYVIFGARRGWWSSPMELSSLNGVNGFILNGESSSDNSGSSVSGAGDINGDGIADLIVGAYDASPNDRSQAGKSYVIFGSKAGWSSPMELSSLNGVNGFILNGEDAYDWSGSSVSGAGDINGDGIADLVVGAPGVYSTNRSAGKSYVIFGQKNSSMRIV